MTVFIFLADTFLSTYSWAALGLTVAALLGGAIAWLLKKNPPLPVVKQIVEVPQPAPLPVVDTTNWEKENASLLKKLKQAEKQQEELKKERNNWKDKFTQKSEEHEKMLLEYQAAKDDMERKLLEYNTLLRRKEQVENKYENLKKEYDLVKYDLPKERNEKNTWKNNAERKEKELADFRNKLIAEQNRILQLQARVKELEDIKAKLDALRLDYKVQTRIVKKLTSDCEYWEKQHYDTHHELSEQINKYEELLDINQEKHLQILRMRDEKKIHLEMIADYKGKFMELHDAKHKDK